MTTYGEYVCANCHGTFTRPRPIEEAMQEARENGFDVTGGIREVCDDCYNEVMERIKRGEFN